MDIFTRDDFKIFDKAGFNERMGAIMTHIRPKLTSIGNELAPEISALVDCPLFVHVAKHARRTVNPPDDTWAALGASLRGYKADVHFKIAVSRHCVRFLFEAGPEYYAKADWVREWQRSFNRFSSSLRTAKELAWFKSEHDEEPAAKLKDLAGSDLKKLADELTRRRDGQLALGRRIESTEFATLKPKQIRKIAADTFGPLSALFALHGAREKK